MKIAILGAGNIGGTLGGKWIRAVQEVLFAVRDPRSPKTVSALEQARGSKAVDPGGARGLSVGTPGLPAAGARRLAPRRLPALGRGLAAQLVGSGVWLDTSYTIGRIPEGLLRQILLRHRPDRLLFGSDSPWEDQASALAALRDLGLPPDLEDRILGRNALDLLGISPQPG